MCADVVLNREIRNRLRKSRFETSGINECMTRGSNHNHCSRDNESFQWIATCLKLDGCEPYKYGWRFSVHRISQQTTLKVSTSSGLGRWPQDRVEHSDPTWPPSETNCPGRCDSRRSKSSHYASRGRLADIFDETSVAYRQLGARHCSTICNISARILDTNLERTRSDRSSRWQCIIIHIKPSSRSNHISSGLCLLIVAITDMNLNTFRLVYVKNILFVQPTKIATLSTEFIQIVIKVVEE